MTTSRTYVKSEVVGSSDKSVSDAIESAIATASRSLRNLEWFEVVDVRGSIRDNKVANYQVTLKLGFTGTIYAINPRRASLAGIRCLNSLADLPEAPDAAFVAVGAAGSLDELTKPRIVGQRQ